jgi:hypothetical protein
MKLKHWVFFALIVVGALFLWHNYSQHGGIAGVKSGIGIG